MIIQRLSLDSNNVSMGALLGVNGNTELLRKVNQSWGAGSFFSDGNDPYTRRFQLFMDQVVRPGYAVDNKVRGYAQQMEIPQPKFEYIHTTEQIAQGIPPCMWDGIVHYEPIRQGIDRGEYDGFGVDPSTLQAEDPYKEVCESGFFEVSPDTVSDDNTVECTCTWYDDDEEEILSPDDATILQFTRLALLDYINNPETSMLDPTNYGNLKG